jgi:adenylate cyclase
MFTDIVDYSDMTALDEDTALDLLTEHNRIMKPLVRLHRGTVVKTIGDAIMGKFAAASDALDCALEMQKRLVERNAAQPQERRLLVRIGVHVGDVVVARNDIFGVVTNLAKRLESVSTPASVCCTDAARLMVHHLPRYAFREQGVWKPKGSLTELTFFSVARGRLT